MENLTTGRPPDIAAVLAAKRGAPEDVFHQFGEGADLVVGLGNGEPVTVIDALEEGGERLSGVTIYQMFPRHERRYMHGDIEGLRHVSWYPPQPTATLSTGQSATSSLTTSATYRAS
jgi:hypothetical protein